MTARPISWGILLGALAAQREVSKQTPATGVCKKEAKKKEKDQIATDSLNTVLEEPDYIPAIYGQLNDMY